LQEPYLKNAVDAEEGKSYIKDGRAEIRNIDF
jgi:hypothetical protein